MDCRLTFCAPVDKLRAILEELLRDVLEVLECFRHCDCVTFLLDIEMRLGVDAQGLWLFRGDETVHAASAFDRIIAGVEDKVLWLWSKSCRVVLRLVLSGFGVNVNLARCP